MKPEEDNRLNHCLSILLSLHRMEFIIFKLHAVLLFWTIYQKLLTILANHEHRRTLAYSP